MFGEAGAALAFMVGVNILALKVLRPPRKLGFLWWHITAVSISVICLSVVTLDVVAKHLGAPATWRTWVALVGFTLMLAAQVIIFHVERQRYLQRLVIDMHGASQLKAALEALEAEDED